MMLSIGEFVLAASCCGAGLSILLFLLWPVRSSRTGRMPRLDTDWRSRPGLAKSAQEHAPATGKSYLVIGTGTVGLRLMEALLQRGELHVKGFDIAAPKRSLQSTTAPIFIQGSINDYASLKGACAGVDVVFATAALIRYFERIPFQYSESHAVNVTGTNNIIQACIECGVQVLVQTSSSNVCIAPDLANMQMDENSPYVDAHNSPNHYGWTKVQAEKAVLSAHGTLLPNGRGRLAAAAIRPCSAIFGPKDALITQKSIEEGHVQMLITKAKYDFVFVDNVVWGHLLLEKQLHAHPKGVGGIPFCISNNEPMNVEDFWAGSLAFFYEQAVKRPIKVTYVPWRLLQVLGWCCEAYQRSTGKRAQNELRQLTPPVFTLASLSYAFSSEKARTILGYEPLYTVDEGLQKTISEWVESTAH